jgi:hypothetical protein
MLTGLLNEPLWLVIVTCGIHKNVCELKNMCLESVGCTFKLLLYVISELQAKELGSLTTWPESPKNVYSHSHGNERPCDTVNARQTMSLTVCYRVL